MVTIKPAYRWALRGIAVAATTVVAIGNVTAEEHISVKIVSVITMILMVWFAFVATADGLAYKTPQELGISRDSIV
ncbi:hypothetical protein HU200_067151 [Digitaria exilis]|uniref:Uncharacterized protein n=1 Tax=Digitaria exilis TaxID=1010633 RepID=A0A835A0Q5_9POAL|nr:hypothetical protein HU200_067151 [Digitaria exilis]